eukprot:3142494-Prymnesium_polylepis.4
MVLAMGQPRRACYWTCCRCCRAPVPRHRPRFRCIRHGFSPSLAAGGCLHNRRGPLKLTAFCIPHVADSIRRPARLIGNQFWQHLEAAMLIRIPGSHVSVAEAVPGRHGGSGFAREHADWVSPLSAVITRTLVWRCTPLYASTRDVVLAS